MGVPKRIKRYEGQHALVDGIPYVMPISCVDSPALFAGFQINADKAKKFLPGNELHPFRLWNGKGLLLITVINYLETSIGKYIEFSIAIACTHGRKPAPRMLPGLFMGHYGTGQYVIDLPVSSEISVKGGKGIWGMPKHQAKLDYEVTDEIVSSQYEKDEQFAMRIEIDRPSRTWIPINVGATNYCQFRNMLMASYIYFKGKAGMNLFGNANARLYIGDHPKTAPLRELEIDGDALLTMFIPEANGILDDHMETWFLIHDEPPEKMPEGLESVVNLGLDEEWLEPPSETDYERYRI
ncbi:acetoacetate decarboxylase family protein [Aliifodinibius sp. S!AR15-10]|uniref:acetoacetate decarboxylase family protein n=1 Tax=Aliifodinibius sp. S!AR15-10 TaxID=2950437 RepID=UPI00285FD24C|nr:acetoacetate decarboxylase family protein [Aliifodinibius sp. S!AR15-10]MDR8389607.1 acetoacetate decarboxylase family protein [Aliifodinibius sp. S!AR15-10]